MLGNDHWGVISKEVICVVGVRTNHGNRLYIFLQRQKRSFISQQDDAFPRGIERQLLMCGRMHLLLGMIQIDIRMLEKPEAKFEFQYPPHGSIDERHWNSAFVNALNQRPHVSWFIGDIQINSCAERQSSRFFLGWNNSLIDQGCETIAFTRDDSFEAELLP